MAGYGILPNSLHSHVVKGKFIQAPSFVLFTNPSNSKNRRDGATVSSRVLAMSDVVGAQLFYSVAAPAPGDISSKQRRRQAIGTDSKL